MQIVHDASRRKEKQQHLVVPGRGSVALVTPPASTSRGCYDGQEEAWKQRRTRTPSKKNQPKRFVVVLIALLMLPPCTGKTKKKKKVNKAICCMVMKRTTSSWSNQQRDMEAPIPLLFPCVE